MRVWIPLSRLQRIPTNVPKSMCSLKVKESHHEPDSAKTIGQIGQIPELSDTEYTSVLEK